MNIHYSPSLHACFDLTLKYRNLPDDLIKITKEEYEIFCGLPPEGKQLAIGVFPFEFEDIPGPTSEELAISAQALMIKELAWADIEVKKHIEGHSRTVSTLEDLYAYKNKCRDYVRNVDGVLTILGDKPERPE